MLLVQGRGEMAHMPAVNEVLIHHCVMNTGIESFAISTV